MKLHLPEIRTLEDRSVLDHSLVESDDAVVLMVKVRSRNTRKIRERLAHELSRAGTRATVVLSSSDRQELVASKWRRRRPSAVKAADTLIGAYLLS